MILVIDNYDSFTYNLVQLLGSLGTEVQVFRNDAIDLPTIARLAPVGIVLSPGPGRPEEAGISLGVITRFGANLPILGVCLGHQAIAQAYGGRVVRGREPVHGKVSRIRHDGKTIYQGIAGDFQATRYHSLVVEEESLPAVLKVSARTPDGVIMGIRHRNFPVEGVQFHPESILTGEGRRLLANFLALARG
ncbi:MAG: aminodeoxychorismate/anthranilate synthase component II [Firmicutes bacterium]|nr:aminodeoxychorismate/anthranilate synthase component II [Bacillota bacterium]MCL5038303.1 aminodeoxychorismate/anthranilate synthase component II [Bacillota bacterium]